jgi:hypothetical protein
MSKESILKRFPELKDEDVFIQNDSDGNGPRIVVWNSDKPIPTAEQIQQWEQEDAQLPKQLTLEQQLAEKDLQIRELKAYTQQLNDDFAALAEFVTNGGN